ncbi:SH3 domain-containing protein [Aquimarina megaterium]|uniref:SH3 domain-containing protein n=1 Tax=Aquimarina megaterium TaxID=1443666 RepID=UPI0004722104|nr:SH3 domain-containing protein [Aquimarina megaterium]
MKIITIIFTTFISLNIYSQEYYFINAKNGLNVRSGSDLLSAKVAKIPYGVLVEKIFDTNKKMTINDNGKIITGNWVKIKYNNYLYLVSKETEPFEKEGYVFDGYLKKTNNNSIINRSQISSVEFNELKQKSSRQIHKPKKISSLDSIKKILKNHIEWTTKFESEEHKREDLIKSIKTKNGQKLSVNQNSAEDYVFAAGWSGYYPEYDILVLEGGHTIDVCFSIQTGETQLTIGNPEYIIPSPQNTHRLNGIFGGHECITYFLQKKINDEFTYLTQFDNNYDICTFKEFYWINETTFIYKIINHKGDDVFFKTEIKDYPVELPRSGTKLSDLIPQGWKVLSTSSGDLNNDDIDDIVFAIQNTLPENLEFNDGPGIDTLDLNPRVLGIYFGKSDHIFEKKLQSNEFIILRDSPTMDEPFDGVKILDNGDLQIDFHFWYSAGSWQMSDHQYTFRYQNEAFELITYESSERHRGSGEETDYKVNFITKKMNTSRMYFDDETDEKSEEDLQKKIEIQQLKSLKSLGKPFEWEFQGVRI